jgi:hypothetical protein
LNEIPLNFRPGEANGKMNPGGYFNPYTAWRLRHDFEGYSIWGRSGRGDYNSWMLYETWDKVQTKTDWDDYLNTNKGDSSNKDGRFLGNVGYDKGLPNRWGGHNGKVSVADTTAGGVFHGYYKLGFDYLTEKIEPGDDIYGLPLYKTKTRKDLYKEAILVPQGAYLTDEQKRYNQLLFKNDHPEVLAAGLTDEVYLALVDDSLIPLPGHLGQNSAIEPLNPNSDEKEADLQARLARRFYYHTITDLPKGREFYASVTAFNRGKPDKGLDALESGKDANMMIFYPGPVAKSNMNNIYVVPNPYRGGSNFDGFKQGDELGDKARRLWFVNLPNKCNVQIFTVAGDLVAEFDHDGEMQQDILSISKAAEFGIAASGIHPWNLLSKHNQIIASGLYFYSVKDKKSGDVKVGKFAVIR